MDTVITSNSAHFENERGPNLFRSTISEGRSPTVRMVSLDRLFEILSKRRRRYVFYYLEQRDGPVPVDELVIAINEWEDETPEEIPNEKFENVEISLQHNHLPKIDEIEYVRYDPEQQVIQINESSPELDAFLTIAKLVEETETFDQPIVDKRIDEDNRQ
jgi:hypothetical protein